MSVVFSPARLVETPAELVGWGRFTVSAVSSDHDVNVHNAGAALLLSALGCPCSDGGSMEGDLSAEDFLGRVLLALGVSPADEGMPAYGLGVGEADRLGGVVAEGGARWVVGARSEGYLQDRLACLHALAVFCRDEGCLVAWA